MTVGMKELMHSESFTGMSADGVFTGEPRSLFMSGIPRIEEAGPFELEPVDEPTILEIQQRCDATHPRLRTLFPAEEGELTPAFQHTPSFIFSICRGVFSWISEFTRSISALCSCMGRSDKKREVFHTDVARQCPLEEYSGAAKRSAATSPNPNEIASIWLHVKR